MIQEEKQLVPSLSWVSKRNIKTFKEKGGQL